MAGNHSPISAGPCLAETSGHPSRVGRHCSHPRRESPSPLSCHSGSAAHPAVLQYQAGQTHWRNCTFAPFQLPCDVQHRHGCTASKHYSISRQYCKHSLVNSLSHLLHFSSPVTVNKQKTLEWSFKNSSAIRACGCNYCVYGLVYSFSFLPSLCNRKCASFQAFCFITIGKKFPKFRVCLIQVPDFILRVTLKSWAGTDLHKLKFLKVLGSSFLLHFPSFSISITLICCTFSFPFSFSDSSYAKTSIPSPSPHYLSSFAHNFPVSPHAVSTAGLHPRYLSHPRQFLSFLSTPSGCLKSSSLFISPLLSSFPLFSMSPSFPLPILFFTVSHSSPSLCSAALQHPTSCLFIFLGPFLVEVALSLPTASTQTFSPLLCLL